ncbi:MAG TPA: acyl-CoA thioester hydrolase/BAAT C-terminal domain-containing protein [Ktedonobacterales bacterium]|nr:acyl-CoA thioester hydrolase/BAAT C-terminal domain-containing protein [Ktedonobacterales bacterium]
MELVEQVLEGELQGVAVGPVRRAACGVLVLAGSSGRVDVARARLLARHRALALALRWFGGPGQPPGICEVPLETFTGAVDWLCGQGVKRVGLLGLSKGAEAALLVACCDARIGAAVAISPSSVAWANVGAGADGQSYPYRSSWTWQGEPLPFVPYDESWSASQTQGPVAYRSLYERSLAAFPERALAAAIPIERTEARTLLIAGGDDEMWPSASFAAALAERRRAAGRQIEVIAEPRAGHRPPFPEEPTPGPSATYRYGGSPEADAALGAAAWPRTLDCLGLPR